MDTKPALQNIQDGFLNTARRERSAVTIHLLSGAKLSGRIKSFDKFSLIIESGSDDLLVFKHAISTVQYGTVNSGARERKETHVSGNLSKAMPASPQAPEIASDLTDRLDS